MLKNAMQIFNLNYYRSIIKMAFDHGYCFETLNNFVTNQEVRKKKVVVLRHDIDSKPHRNRIFFEVEKEFGIHSSNFLLVHDVQYNPFAVNVLGLFREMELFGSEIGLHTNYVETAQILGLDPVNVLDKEINALRGHFNIKGVACHRNCDFMANSLPHLEKHWASFKKKFALNYQAYEDQVLGKLVFVNEGLNPHLGWRNQTPEAVIASGKSFCMSTHPHWWHREHAFED